MGTLNTAIFTDPVNTTDTGTTTFEEAAFGNPLLAITMATGHAGGDADKALINDATFTFGWAEGTGTGALDQTTIGCVMEHSPVNQDSGHAFSGQDCLALGILASGRGVEGWSRATTFPDTNGYIGTTTNTLGDDFNAVTSLLSGSAISSRAAGVKQLTASGTTTFNPGFQADVILFLGSNAKNMSAARATSTGCRFAVGVAVRDAGATTIQGQGSLSVSDNWNDAAGAPKATVSNTQVQRPNNSSDTKARWGLAVNSIAAGGDVTIEVFDSSDDAAQYSATIGTSNHIAWYAFKLADGHTPLLINQESPTGDGVDTITTSGITPEWVLMIQTFLDTYDNNPDSAQAGAWSVSMMDASTQRCCSFQAENNADPMNTSSTLANQALYTPSDAGSVADSAHFAATLDSFNSGNLKLDYTSELADGRKQIFLVIGADVVASTTSTLGTLGVG